MSIQFICIYLLIEFNKLSIVFVFVTLFVGQRFRWYAFELIINKTHYIVGIVLFHLKTTTTIDLLIKIPFVRPKNFHQILMVFLRRRRRCCRWIFNNFFVFLFWFFVYRKTTYLPVAAFLM